jgi:hypothetical protein
MVQYTLQDVLEITFNGFDITLPEETIKLIQELSNQVGSPTYVKTPTFPKKDMLDATVGSGVSSFSSKKKRMGSGGSKSANSDFSKNCDWENVRSFHVTKMEQKVGLDVEIDLIRSYLNKMTDKNYSEKRDSIIGILDKLIEEEISDENLSRVSGVIFDIASNNRFFSKLYAELYKDLMSKYEIMQDIFEESFEKFMELFSLIEYVDPDKDYDTFCKINKNNEMRKALSAFFVNLCILGVLSSSKLTNLVRGMLVQVNAFIKESNKKCEVDELTENIVILYNKDLLLLNDSSYFIDGESMQELIERIASYKAKNYSSLSSKAIFKYMDIVEKS